MAQVEGILEERVVPDAEIRVPLSEMGRILQECSAKEKHKLYKCISSHSFFCAPRVVQLLQTHINLITYQTTFSF